MNNKEIILAIDSTDIKEIKNILDEVAPAISNVKIGPISFLSNYQSIIDLLKSFNLSIMFDFKFFDIPNTMAESLDFLFRNNINIFTVHSLAGPTSLSLLNQKLIEKEQSFGIKKPKMFCVSILTSFDQSEMNAIGLSGTIKDNILNLVESSINAGADGVVCSGHEISLIRENFGDQIEILVPGIRFNSDDGDQKRVISPRLAFEKGANYIVLGRTVTESKNRKDKLNDIIKSLK